MKFEIETSVIETEGLNIFGLVYSVPTRVTHLASLAQNPQVYRKFFYLQRKPTFYSIPITFIFLWQLLLSRNFNDRCAIERGNETYTKTEKENAVQNAAVCETKKRSWESRNEGGEFLTFEKSIRNIYMVSILQNFTKEIVQKENKMQIIREHLNRKNSNFKEIISKFIAILLDIGDYRFLVTISSNKLFVLSLNSVYCPNSYY